MKYFKVLCPFLLTLSLCNSLYAYEEGFYSTTALSISSLPDREFVTYDDYRILGGFTSDIYHYGSIEDFTDDTLMSRKYNISSKVSVPAFAKLSLIYYWYNNTPNDIEVDKIRVPITREIVSKGDISKHFILNENINITEEKTCTDTFCKGGRFLEFDGPGILQSDIGENPGRGTLLYTFVIRPRAVLIDWSVEYWDDNLSELRVFVQNTTDDLQEDIWLNYKESVSKRFDLEPNEIREVLVYKSCPKIGNQINCGRIRFIDQSTKGECSVYGSKFGANPSADSYTVFSSIEGEWVAGSYVQPNMESFCVERIKHTYYTDELILDLEPQQPQSIEQYWQDLLNLEILPITNTLDRLLKRFLTVNLNIYESNNFYTRLRTKYSKTFNR